jgi:nicotinate-nucleotide--dimethylbenzimidazole phosphoribosyltransferase
MKRIEDYLSMVNPADGSAAEEVQRRLDLQTKPPGSLGMLERLCTQVAAAQWTSAPKCERRVIFTMAADHGVTEEGVSAYPQSVTAQMVMNFVKGGAAVNVLARQGGCAVVVVDMGVARDLDFPGYVHRKIAHGTANFTRGPAMSREQAERAIVTGIELALECEYDLLGTGDMGIGNTTAASAVGAVLTGLDPEEVTGRGTGVDDRGLTRKIDAVRRGIAVNKPDPSDPLDVLAKVGGFEIAGIAGLVIACAVKKKLAVVDGFISTAGAMVAAGLNRHVSDYFVLSHQSAENGHDRFCAHLGKKPILDLGMRLGEGTGAAIAIGVIDASIRLLYEMATFEQAGVDRKLPGAREER